MPVINGGNFFYHIEFKNNETLKKYGGIDIFVSNAATNPTFGPLFDVSSIKYKYKYYEYSAKQL